MLALLAISACAAPVPATPGPWRTVMEQPTSPYATVNVDYAPFDAKNSLTGINVLFRGVYQEGHDKRVSWKTRSGTTTDAYVSVHTIKLSDVLYGSLPAQDVIQAVSSASWESGDLDVPLRSGQEFYFLGHAFTEEDRKLPQQNPDNQLNIFELGDVHIARIAYLTMPVSGGIVQFWREWPLEGVTLPTVRPLTLGEGITTMPQKEFEQKILSLLLQTKSIETPTPSPTR